mmetsp:Transcript_80361/g.186604  ORF Transcript_80361/g.186604 Transcript_80361/m.186604 type:complete len:119 (+) Transcript_80361:388-744(+)
MELQVPCLQLHTPLVGGNVLAPTQTQSPREALQPKPGPGMLQQLDLAQHAGPVQTGCACEDPNMEPAKCIMSVMDENMPLAPAERVRHATSSAAMERSARAGIAAAKDRELGPKQSWA